MVNPGKTAPYQIDVSFDHMLSLAQAAKLLPEPPCPTTLWRWRTKGVAGVKLAAVKCGSRWLTSKEALAAFIAAQTAATQPAQSEPTERSPEMARQLKKAGIL